MSTLAGYVTSNRKEASNAEVQYAWKDVAAPLAGFATVLILLYLFAAGGITRFSAYQNDRLDQVLWEEHSSQLSKAGITYIWNSSQESPNTGAVEYTDSTGSYTAYIHYNWADYEDRAWIDIDANSLKYRGTPINRDGGDQNRAQHLKAERVITFALDAVRKDKARRQQWGG